MIKPPTIIHIGKCGGSSIKSVLPDTYKTLHATRPALGPNGKYVAVIRNPIHRFVSAFYHMHSAYSVCDTANQKALNYIEKNRQKFSLYETANGLAEAIYDEDCNLNMDAHHLITRGDLPTADVVQVITEEKTAGGPIAINAKKGDKPPHRYITVYRPLDGKEFATSNMIINYSLLSKTSNFPVRMHPSNDPRNSEGAVINLIKPYTIMDSVNDEGVETNQHMDNHLGMNIAWYIEDLIKNQSESIVGVIRCEHIHGDVLSVLGFECKEHRNSHTLHDNWGKPYDDTLSDRAVNNLKKYLKKDYECLLALKDMGLIDEEYYNFCIGVQ